MDDLSTQLVYRQPTGGAELSLLMGSTVVLGYLTIEEELQICQQFQGSEWKRNSQVMWTGIPRECAQQWADQHQMQTLTTAMGPLMVSANPLCLKEHKTREEWSKYIKGASAIFAGHISRGEKVVVLSRPPPGRFHPFGLTTYQGVEEPILKGGGDVGTGVRIDVVHPTVKGAENFCYQIWPIDETCTWLSKFGTLAPKMAKIILGKVGIEHITKPTLKRGVTDGVIPLNQERRLEEGMTNTRRKDKSLKGKNQPKCQEALSVRKKGQIFKVKVKKAPTDNNALRDDEVLKAEKTLKVINALKAEEALKAKKALKVMNSLQAKKALMDKADKKALKVKNALKAEEALKIKKPRVEKKASTAKGGM